MNEWDEGGREGGRSDEEVLLLRLSFFWNAVRGCGDHRLGFLE